MRLPFFFLLFEVKYGGIFLVFSAVNWYNTPIFWVIMTWSTLCCIIFRNYSKR